MPWSYAADAKNAAGVSDPRAGIPAPANAAAMASEGAGAWDGQFWDQAKLDAAIKAQKVGDDGRKVVNNDSWMSALNPLSGLTKSGKQAVSGYGPSVTTAAYGSGENYQEAMTSQGAPIYGDVYTDKLGRNYKTTKGADGDPSTYVQYIQNDGGGFADPTGNGRDRVQPIYKLNADGTATPHSANTSYTGSEWVRNGRDVAIGVATMVAAYFGGSWLAAYEAGAVAAPVAGAAATESGAAAIAQSSATQTALYGNAGYGATTSAEAGFAGLGGTTAGGSAGLTAAEVAAVEGGGGFAAGGGATGAPGVSTAATTPTATTATTTATKTAASSLVPGMTNAELAKLGISAGLAVSAQGKASDAAKNATDAASKNAADLAANATDQLSFNKAVYADGAAARQAALETSIAASKSQLAAQDQQTKIAGEYNDYNKATFRPLEQGIVKDATEFDTPEKRQAAADSSMADVNSGFASTNAARARQLAASGIDPTSTRSMSVLAGNDVAQAEQLAGAAYKARKGVETTGFARKMDAASLGRNLPSAQSTAAATGIQAGSAATSSAASGVQAQQAGVPNMNAGYNGASSTLSSAGGINSNVARLQQQADQYDSQLWGQVGNFAGSVISDENVKTDIEPTTDEEALEATNATPVSNWRYDPAKMAAEGLPMDDGAEHTGPMAQDVAETMGEEAAPGGKRLDLVTMNGVNMKAIQAVDKKVEVLTKQMSSIASMIRGGKISAGARA